MLFVQCSSISEHGVCFLALQNVKKFDIKHYNYASTFVNYNIVMLESFMKFGILCLSEFVKCGSINHFAEYGLSSAAWEYCILESVYEAGRFLRYP